MLFTTEPCAFPIFLSLLKKFETGFLLLFELRLVVTENDPDEFGWYGCRPKDGLELSIFLFLPSVFHHA